MQIAILVSMLLRNAFTNVRAFDGVVELARFGDLLPVHALHRIGAMEHGANGWLTCGKNNNPMAFGFQLVNGQMKQSCCPRQRLFFNFMSQKRGRGLVVCDEPETEERFSVFPVIIENGQLLTSPFGSIGNATVCKSQIASLQWKGPTMDCSRLVLRAQMDFTKDVIRNSSLFDRHHLYA